MGNPKMKQGDTWLNSLGDPVKIVGVDSYRQVGNVFAYRFKRTASVPSGGKGSNVFFRKLDEPLPWTFVKRGKGV